MYQTDDLTSADIRKMAEENPKVPKPRGYQVLITVPEVSEKSGGGVYLPDSLTEREKRASIIGLVTLIGPDAYNDKKRFPSGPYCEVGDWVVFRSYGGQVLYVDGIEYRLINDETVLATVEDPRGLKRS